jgi:hypothetical protein
MRAACAVQVPLRALHQPVRPVPGSQGSRRLRGSERSCATRQLA